MSEPRDTLTVRAKTMFKSTSNVIVGLATLSILGLIAFVVFRGERQDRDERRIFQSRETLIQEATAAAEKRGLGNVAALRERYVAMCDVFPVTVLEGNADSICEAQADELVEQSRRRGMTAFDYIDLGYDLCVLDVRRDGEDPDRYCRREDYRDDLLYEALAFSLCAFERAWVFEVRFENQVSKRGPDVYANHERRVDCERRLAAEWDYDGFFDGLPDDEEDEWPALLDQLYESYEAGDKERVLELLATHEYGRDERSDRWILSMAIEPGEVELLQQVLEQNGGRVNFEREYYDQPLALAIEREASEAALLLLEAGADPLWPQAYGTAPIVNAAGKGMLDVVRDLVARGADVNGVNGSESLDFGEPLRWAARIGHEETALWLLDNGARITPEEPSQFPMSLSDRLLDDAVVGGDLVVVQALVDAGAHSEEPLRLFVGAVEGGSPEVLSLLFELGYELPDRKHHDRIYDKVVDAIQEEGKSTIEDGVAMFELLLEHDLEMAWIGDSGWNYGHQAVIHYAPPTISFDTGDERADVVRAYRLRFVKRVIDEVLAAGIDIDHRYKSNTMLMKAADGGQPELARYLLELGADASLINDDGRTALDIAVGEGRRLTAFWDENEALRSRFAALIEILGGTADALDRQ